MRISTEHKVADEVHAYQELVYEPSKKRFVPVVTNQGQWPVPLRRCILEFNLMLIVQHVATSYNVMAM